MGRTGFSVNHTAVRYAGATLVFVVAFAVWMHPLALHPGSRIAYGFADATGTLRFNWVASIEHRGPLNFRHDSLSGAPEGLNLAPATNVWNSGIQTGFVWEVGRAIGAVAAWNLFIFIGFIATGLAMFCLLERLGCTPAASLFGSYVFAFNPYMFERTYAGHIAYLQNWVFVVLAAALIFMRERRSLASVVVVGAAVALTFYMAAYDGLFAGLMVFVFGLVEFARLPVRRERWRTAGLVGASFVVSVVALAPVFLMYSREQGVVTTVASHSSTDLYHFAARPLAYLLPSPRNPLFHWLKGAHPSDLTEQTLFFGYSTLALAIVAIVMLKRRAAWFTASESRRWTTIFFITLGAAAFIMSLPPSYKIGKAGVPMPSLVIAVATSFWRVYSRFGIIVGLALVVLASLALTALAERRGLLWQSLAPIAIALVVFVELLPGNVAAVNTSAKPAWVAWLARAPHGIVATYPIALGRTPAVYLSQEDFWYQTLDHQPRFEYFNLGPLLTDGRPNSIRVLARDLSEPLSARILATEGVRYVVVHDDVYQAIDEQPPKLPAGNYTLLARFPNVRIYSVRGARINLLATLRAHRRALAKFEGVPPSALTGLGPLTTP